MTDSCPSGSRHQPTLAVPLAAAKDQLFFLEPVGDQHKLQLRQLPALVACAEGLQPRRTGVVMECDLLGWPQVLRAA